MKFKSLLLFFRLKEVMDMENTKVMLMRMNEQLMRSDSAICRHIAALDSLGHSVVY